MAIFSTKIKIGALGQKRRAELRAIVDTGVFLSIVPRNTLKKLAIPPLWRRKFTLADGREIHREVGVAIFQINGQKGASEIVFGEPGDKILLGALTLESLGLKVNPRKKRIEPEELLLL